MSSEQGAGDGEGTAPVPVYPQQELLPHDVKPARSRRPLAIAVIVVLLALVAGGLAWFVLAGDGDEDREAYCDALRDFTNDGDLASIALGDTDSVNQQADELADLAPSAVDEDWQTLIELRDSPPGSTDVDLSAALAAITALQGIASDAGDECGVSIDLPSF